MTLGTHHHVTGTLRRTRFNYLYILEMKGGHRWRLDILQDVTDLVGKRVEVEGQQSDYDMLDVHKIWQQGDPRPLSPWEQLETAIRTLRRREGL